MSGRSKHKTLLMISTAFITAATTSFCGVCGNAYQRQRARIIPGAGRTRRGKRRAAGPGDGLGRVLPPSDRNVLIIKASPHH